MNAKKNIGLATIAVITFTGAIIHGYSSQRWGAGEGTSSAGERLANISQELPGWSLESSGRIDEASRTMLESTGDLVRVYSDAISASKVTVSIVMGPPGTISVHSPEVCLPSRNFEQLGAREEMVMQDAAGVEHRLWKVTFQARDAGARLLRVYYAWSTGEAWSAPESPRFQFVGSPYLYKIQLAGNVSSDDSPDDQLIELMKELLPAVSRELVSVAPVNVPSTDEV